MPSLRQLSTLLIGGVLCLQQLWAANIAVDADAGQRPISPYLYGRNNVVGKAHADVMRQAGVRILRENGGNNSTKFNWKQQLSSHPDWYNNVYTHDWNGTASTIQTSFPGVQGFFGFQLLGWVADNTSNNFNDWSYNGSSSWSGIAQDLAGGGTLNPAGGSTALAKGDPRRYLREWPADSSTGILDHWFGSGGLGYDPQRFLYWSMDNEPESWNGTHDDVVTSPMPVEQYMQNYFKVALAARAKFPGIKLVGPVFTNEWQWFKWQTDITYKGRYHTWMEYFIRRVGEKQDSTGVRLLDVLDFHFYPRIDGTNPTDAGTLANIHRIWYDTTWAYPKANGIKTINGAWDTTQDKYYIWKRNQAWMDQWLGAGHGVTFGLSECGNLSNVNAQQVAHWYASQLGVFADHGVELFTPWEWYAGQLEVLHLYTSSAKGTRVLSTSDADTLVSAYSSINPAGDSLTVILVNHHTTAPQSATVSLSHFTPNSATATTRSLSGLSGETFTGASSNAMSPGSVAVAGNSFTIDLPPLGITAVLLKTDAPTRIAGASQLPARLEWRHQGDQLMIAGGARPGTLRLWDSRGKLVRSVAYTGQALAVSLGDVPRGLLVGSLGQEPLRLVRP